MKTRLNPWLALSLLLATACVGFRTPLDDPEGGVAPPGRDNFTIPLSPIRQLDLVVMIDNSPSMAPKQEKLRAQFPKLLDPLKDLATDSLPDLHVAIIDSDLGTDGAYTSGSCGPKTLPDGTTSLYGDQGRFQMIGATACGVTDPNARFLISSARQPTNFRGDIDAVFACLAGGLGTLGCGEEHQLQAFEWALVQKGIGNDAQQEQFLRPDAYLGLVFLSDEDDCSAATNDGMFGVSPGGTNLGAESASLRCSTRAHQCGGRNLTKAPPGYPTSAAFSAPFSTCAARTDACPNQSDGAKSGTDTSVPTSCSPLKDVKRLADTIKSLKSAPDKLIFVAGIFGWPLDGQDTLPYKIDLIPNPSTDPSHPEVFDAWPICYDPQHYSATDQTTYNLADVGFGAVGGLREAAFIDQFGENGSKFSICQSDFSNSLGGIGSALAYRMPNLCLDAKLVDTDVAVPGLQPDCLVFYLNPVTGPNGQVNHVKGSLPLPECDAGASPETVTADCWRLLYDTTRCPGQGQWVDVVRTAAEIAQTPQIPEGTELSMQCRVCTPANSAALECAY
jgi:hypothetical protein